MDEVIAYANRTEGAITRWKVASTMDGRSMAVSTIEPAAFCIWSFVLNFWSKADGCVDVYLHDAGRRHLRPVDVNQAWAIGKVLGEPTRMRPQLRGKRVITVKGPMPIRH